MDALQRIVTYQMPLKVEPVVEKFYADTADLDPVAERRERLRDLKKALRDLAFAAEFIKDPLEQRRSSEHHFYYYAGGFK